MQSTLIGTVLEGVPVFEKEIRGEKFYTILVQFFDAPMKVLMSEYVMTSKYEGTIAVTGCVTSTHKRKTLPKFYFYASTIEAVDIDTPLSNEISFDGKIVKIGEFKLNTRNHDILPLVLKSSSPFHKQDTILYLCTKNTDARLLKDKPPGYNVTGTGYLKAYKDIFEVLVTSIEVIS